MSSKLLKKVIESYRNLSLQNIIILPFLLQICIVVGLVGYFSWRSGKQAVNIVTSQLRSEVSEGVEQHLEDYLKIPHLIVQLKQNSVRTQQLDTNNFPAVQQDFWSTIQLFDSVRAIYIGKDTGKFIYTKHERDLFYSKETIETPKRKTYLLDDLGQKKELVTVDEYDPRFRPWYINTLKTQENNWSKIYPFTGGELGITAAGLLKDSQGNVKGIVGVDLVLTGINRFLERLEISENGEVFILERNGYLVATSTTEKPFTLNADGKNEQRLRAIDSECSLLKSTTNYMTARFGSLDNIKRAEQLEFELDNSSQLVQVVPYKNDLGLDWLIVVAIPEADFMEEITANTLNTVKLCSIALAIATIVGIYTSRRITRPITNLSQVTSTIAKSARDKNISPNFHTIAKAKSIKELQSLARSFNEMVTQLARAFKDLENSNITLEKRVQQRTEDLVIAKEAADAANRAKSEFLANMSHELRTPLHAILGFTQVALQDKALKPQQKENLLTVKRSGEHLLTLINDVLEMSKIEAGSLTLDLQTFDLHLLLDDLAKMFELQLAAISHTRSPEKNIKLTFDRDPNLPQYIKTDPVKLKQILINLIQNGIKFTDRGAVTLDVIFTAEVNNQKIAFAVLDTGRGILSSELEAIFVPFTQTKESEREGTGLGLAICQQFVRLLGGEITVSSQLGQGSLFKFQIPVEVDYIPDARSMRSPNQNSNLSLKNRECSISHRAISLPNFANVQTEWIEQLYQAAIAIDSDLIIQLIQQISSVKTDLAQELTKMVKSFEYDEILEFAQQELARRES